MADFQTKFLRWESSTKDCIDVKRIYIDMAESINAGLMLSQLVFWYLPNKEGGSKLTVSKDGYEWIARQDSEWLYECRLTVKQARRAAEKLEELGLVVCSTFKFGSHPVKHYRINWDEFERKHNSILYMELDRNTVQAYWDEIHSKDGRSVSTVKSSTDQSEAKISTPEESLESADYQKGKLPKRQSTTEVDYQKGNPPITEKVKTIHTEITAEITDSEILVVRGADEGLRVVNGRPAVDISSLNSKETVVEALLNLLDLVPEAENYVREVRLGKNGQPLKQKPENPDFTACEGRMMAVVNEVVHILSRGSADWKKESKHAKSLVLNITREGRFTLEDVVVCAAWAYAVGKFDLYAVSAVSIPKLMPQFLDLKQTGRLKESIGGAGRFESSAQRSERIYGQRDNRRISENAAKLAEDTLERHGVKLKPII